MKANDVRKKYLDYFIKRGHVEIKPAPIIPEVDTGTLFTPFGMQQLTPYLMGEKHPDGTRLVNSQPSIRLDDIEEVGDNRHTTFFEMLGNWSLGDYFKEEQLDWFFGLLTDEFNLDPQRIFVTVFSGDTEFGVKQDDESIDIWKKLFSKHGIKAEYKEMGSEKNASILGMGDAKIFGYDAKKNWWSMNGTPSQMPLGDIGGPDSEVFYDFGQKHGFHENSEFKNQKCHPNCDCGRFIEIGNSVFMQYKKAGQKKLEELPNKNVDFGGGFERIVAATLDDPDVFKSDLFQPVIKALEEFTGTKYNTSAKIDTSFRIVADHLRAASYLLASGVMPGNKLQGYFVRRLIRRAVFHLRMLGFDLEKGAISTFIKSYSDDFDLIKNNWYQMKDALNLEAIKFNSALDRGTRKLTKLLDNKVEIDGNTAFDLYQTEGFPLELTLEMLEDHGIKFTKEDKKEFEDEFEKHKTASRTATSGMFKGGLADKSEDTIKLHTATHLIHWALRTAVSEDILQKGSNITSERLRFDFNFDQKLSDQQISKIEQLVNEKITEALPVNFAIMDKDEALKTGAIHAFGEKYSDKVKIYFIGKSIEEAFSKEFCGGPHVTNTKDIGHVTITKQQKIGAGLVRLYAEID
ncbi:alanine--tRNA ligase [Candidatus Woesebacteria bacterium]|nr:MAG: alanine--tRNA ligase [Candidatus Woesebacteria bacterium]